jgi:transcription factor WhiB
MTVPAFSNAAEWAGRACASVHPDVFFPDTPPGVRAAQVICAGCPVLARCAAASLQAGVTDGVFASVLMPASSRTQARERAEKLLARVAATGRPVRVGSSGKKSRDLYLDPELQARVASLRDGRRMTWRRITAAVGCTGEVARRAYDLHTAMREAV